MTKATVTRLFVGSAIAVASGAIMAVAAVWIAIANDVFILNGNDIVGLRWTAVTWATLGLGLVGSLAVIGGMIAGLVSWIGALLNTSQLESKTWFLVLLLLGIFSFGVIGMLAYVIAGPDGARRPAPSPAQAAA